MSYTMTLRGGERDFSLMYDTSSTVPIAARPSSFVDEAAPRPIWHLPEAEDGNDLVDLTYDDGRWNLTVRVGPATTMALLNETLAALRRTVRQAHAHAKGEPWADEVYIEVVPSSGGTSTYFTVKLVEDRSGGLLSGAQIPSIMLENLAIAVTVSAAGYGDEETLNNALRNGHMLIESATAGLAAGFSLSGSAPTVSLDTSVFLIGGQAQKLVTDDANTQYLQTPTVGSAAADDYVKGYAWLAVDSPGDAVYLSLYDGSLPQSISDVEVTAANAVATKESCGKTWHKIVVSGQLPNDDTFMRVIRSAGNATQATTVYVDGVYLEYSASAIPATRVAWADYPQVHNRNDPTAANPERVDRLDVWGIPGDMPAWMTLTADTDSTALVRLYLARNLQPETATTHLVEGEDAAGGTDTANAYCSGGYYNRTSSDGQRAVYLDASKYNGVWHVLVRARASNVNNRQRSMVGFGTTYQYGDWTYNSVADRWQMLFLGTVDLRTGAHWRSGVLTSKQIYWASDVDISAGTLDIDYWLFLPAGVGNLMLVTPAGTYTAGEKLHVVGREREVIGEDAALLPERCSSVLGGVWTLEPGILNRLIFAFRTYAANNGGGDDDAVWVVWVSDLTLKYRPRTRGLLP
jgi:hypothetical protein